MKARHSRHERRVHTVNAFLSGDHRICTVNAKKRAMNAPSHNSCKNAFKLRSLLLKPSHRRPATLRTSRSSPRMPCRSAPWSRPLVNVCHYGHRRRSPPFRVAFSRRAGCSERERERERQTGVRVCACYVSRPNSDPNKVSPNSGTDTTTSRKYVQKTHGVFLFA